MRTKILAGLWVLLASLCLPVLTHATTVYLDPTAGACAGNYSIANRNCTGADGTSYATIATATNASTAGDTILVREATIPTILDTSGKTGTAANPITVRAFTGETVTFQVATANTYAISRGTSVAYWVFDGLIFDGVNASDLYGLLFNTSEHHLTFQNGEIKNFYRHGIIWEGDGFVVRNNKIHDLRTDCGSGRRWYGLYYSAGNDGLIEGNELYNNPGGGFQLYPGPTTGAIVRNNYIHNNASCSNASFGGMLTGGGQTHNSTITRNIFANNTGATGHGLYLYNNTDNNLIYNNIFYGNDQDGLRVHSSTSANNVIKNNLFGANGGDAITDLGTNTTKTHNACTAAQNCGTTNKLTITAITDCAPSTSDFTLKVASNCLNVGTNVGLPFNTYTGHTNPDIGAWQSIGFATCSVEDGDASNLRVTFTNNVAPPLLPASAVTGVTTRKAGANNPITGSTRVGDSRFDFALTNAIANGEAVDLSASATNITDSSLIGVTLNQPYVQTLTNQSCTNNVGAAASHVFTQAAFEFNYPRGTEAAPVRIPQGVTAENVSVPARPGATLRLRLAVTCTTADCPPTGFYPRYSRNAGGYTNVVPDLFGADNIAFCGTGPDPDIPASGGATTDQMSTSGTFAAGAIVRTSNAIPIVDIALNGKTELEYCFALDSDAVVGDTYDIRIYQQDGTALTTYTNTPRITVVGSAGGSGF